MAWIDAAIASLCGFCLLRILYVYMNHFTFSETPFQTQSSAFYKLIENDVKNLQSWVKAELKIGHHALCVWWYIWKNKE